MKKNIISHYFSVIIFILLFYYNFQKNNYACKKNSNAIYEKDVRK